MEAAKEHQKGKSLEARLAKYGLGADVLNADTLRVTSRTKVRLDATGKGLPPSCWLRPSGIPQLKQWIGVSQSAVSANPGKFNARRAGKLPPTNLGDAITKRAEKRADGDCPCKGRRMVEPEVKEFGSAIRDVLRQYIYGDSRELKPYERLLDLRITLEYPFWFFNTVVVEEGGVLEFGAGANSLVADTLIIEEGGEIRSEGSLKIDCRRIARS